MNGFFYIPLKPYRLPGSEPVPPPVVEIHATKRLFQRRSSYPWGQHYRVVDVAEFRDRLSNTRQELKVRRSISLPSNEGGCRAIKRPPSAHSIHGSEYSVTNFGENRVYNAAKVRFWRLLFAGARDGGLLDFKLCNVFYQFSRDFYSKCTLNP